MNGQSHQRAKWRPHLRSVILAILLTAMALPLTGLFFFRVYENQLIRQTETELIAQSAALAAIYAREINAANIPETMRGQLIDNALRPDPSEPYHPVLPALDLAVDPILESRPDAIATTAKPYPAYKIIGEALDLVLEETQKATLAGFRLLDPDGLVVAGRSETGMSLAHVPEVAAALQGRFKSVLRTRISDEPPPPVYSVSRGTRVRVFVAFPVVIDHHVAGVVYASRTPSNIVKHLHEERGKLMLATLVTLLAVLLLGFVAARTITRPILELTARTRRIADGDAEAMHPLIHHGTREVAELSRSFLAMAQQLKGRSDHLANFAAHVSHELKSPLTSIQGAAELIRDSAGTMSSDEQKHFLANISADAQRLTLLVRRLQDLARAEAMPETAGPSTLDQAVQTIKTNSRLAIRLDAPGDLLLAMAADNLAAVIGNLVENAAHHGATILDIVARRDGMMAIIDVTDNGTGISPNNRDRVFDPFFTTRRSDGGTGMGLGIVRAMLEAHGGSIVLAPSQRGAAFRLAIPAWVHP